MSLLTVAGTDKFDSISEGCFLIIPESTTRHNGKPSKRGRKSAQDVRIARRKQMDGDAPITHGGFQPLLDGEESLEALELRRQGFNTLWTRTEGVINDILLDMNCAALCDIVHFVNHPSNMGQDASLWTRLPYNEIPTGLVFAGINTPDHDAQFSQIEQVIKDPSILALHSEQPNHVALLQSKDCSTLRGMMKNVVEQFLAIQIPGMKDNTMDEVEEDNDDNDEHDDHQRVGESMTSMEPFQLADSQAKPSRLPNYDFQILEGWYDHVRRSVPENGHAPNLVVILQDFESFDPVILQDFVAICSEYRQRVPLVLIIGIATSSEILHESLTKSTISLLRISKFWLQQSEVWFNRVIEKLFIDMPDSLKFGARPYKFLLDHFYLFDFSMGKVSAGVKFALMHHFYGNPLSIFVPLINQSQEERVKHLSDLWSSGTLNPHYATHLRMLSSFRAHIDTLCETNPRDAFRLMEDDHYLLTSALPEFLEEIVRYQHKFKLGIDLVGVLQDQFPTLTSLQCKTRRILLLEALESRESLATRSESIKWLVSLVRKLDPEPLQSLVERLLQSLAGNDLCRAAVETLTSILDKIQTIDEADKHYNARMEKKAKRLEGMMLPDVDVARHTETSRKVQLESIDHLKRKGTDMSKIAMEVSDWCHQTLQEWLTSYTTIPMHELVYYTHVRLHEKSFAAQPRATIQTGLSQAHHYINCECCTKENRGHILPSEPDTSILYKLYLECGRMINLYDWFVAFGCIVEREHRPDGKPPQESEVQARFIRSVAELQFLGFIRSTQRKTDHVLRLTWFGR